MLVQIIFYIQLNNKVYLIECIDNLIWFIYFYSNSKKLITKSVVDIDADTIILFFVAFAIVSLIVELLIKDW